MRNDVLSAALLVVEALEALPVPYLIGGSLSSTLYGMARSTMDADLVADLHLEHAEPLARALGSAFYVDVQSIREAIERRRSFNAIHLQTGFKVDIFVCRDRPFDRMQLQRRVSQGIDPAGERTVYFATAEDTILAKLEWFRLGGEISERQWSDVLGVLKVQGSDLDFPYLRRWAGELGVADLLLKTLEQAGLP